MRPFIRGLSICLLPLALLVLAGCTYDSPIDVSQKWDLKPGDMKWVKNTGVASVTKIKVDVKTTSGIPFDAALVYDEHFEEAKQALKSGQEPPNQLACRMGGEEFGTTKHLEPNKTFVVIVRNPSTMDSCSVKVEVKSGSALRK